MLRNLNSYAEKMKVSEQLACDSQVNQATARHNRNEEEDMKTAIEELYRFKKNLDKLHPICMSLIEKILQNNDRFNY